MVTKTDLTNFDLPKGHILLQCCWVCKQKFASYGGEKGFFEHRHHIVPRAYGGKDGPEVSLCDSHHNAAHQLALRLEKQKMHQELLTGDKQQDKRLYWLATIICNAKAYTQNDPNKPVPVMFVAKGETKRKLKLLKKIHRVSYADLIELAISNLYAKSFQK